MTRKILAMVLSNVGGCLKAAGGISFVNSIRKALQAFGYKKNCHPQKKADSSVAVRDYGLGAGQPRQGRRLFISQG